MIAYLIRRILQSIVVMLAVALIAFSLFRYVGDPVVSMVGRDTTYEQREALRKELGLTDPVVVQFARFVKNASMGNFGISYEQRRPVIDLIAERAPATIELSLISGLFALVVGIFMGVYSGLHRNGFLSKVFQSVSLVGISLPPFLVGILLIYGFAVILGWLPSMGRGGIVKLGFWTHRIPHAQRVEVHYSALHHTGPFPDDPHHATGTFGNAGGAENRLHQV